MTNRGKDDPTSTLDFYYRSVDRYADWVKYSDAKAAGILILLGLGLNDLIGQAGRFVDVHRTGGIGWLATVGFWIACGIAAYVVVRCALAFFPRLAARGDSSLFYFGTVNRNYTTPTAYRAAVEALPEDGIACEVGSQAWELARIADEKFRQSQKALFWTLLFLVAWVTARVALAYAG